MSWDVPSPAVAEAGAALFAEPDPYLRCACGWIASRPGDGIVDRYAHRQHRSRCQARWAARCTGRAATKDRGD